MNGDINQEFNLTPDPRVLQMLGEISLPQWRCLAELIDNSIDGFVHSARAGSPIPVPAITILLPLADKPDARVSVSDNGPGMSFESLESAIRAGWSGNDPLSNLGLFGMGFNIATARLGLVTEVWTSRQGDPEEVGVRIDLDELKQTNSFKVPRQSRVKSDAESHGTTIVISRLKSDQRAYFSRSGNQKTVRKHLERTYSSLLDNSEAGKIRLMVGSVRLFPRLHCIWGESRGVPNPDGSTASAVERIDVDLAPRRYCVSCMRGLSHDESECPSGSAACRIVETRRRIHGWIGLQRHLHNTEFGIDFIRNGRKIEISNKELFEWNDGERAEVEYPIDDQRGRGRIVGEIHLDHCRVSYTKDRFERDDPSWAEMIRVVRGEGPLRPLVAKQRGYGENSSPLYRIYQSYRRSSPQGKNGLWSRILVVKDNERALQMAALFEDREPEYLSDDRWWELVLEQDAEGLGVAPMGDLGGKPADDPLGFSDSPENNAGDKKAEGGDQGKGEERPDKKHVEVAPERTQIHELTRKYVHPTYRVEYDVVAFAVATEDPDLPAGAPWLLRIDEVSSRTYGFLIDVTHDIFRSTTMAPLDALLVELSHRTVDFLKGQVQDPSISTILADFRREYSVTSRLDPQEIVGAAITAMTEIARSIPALINDGSGKNHFDELKDSEREEISRRMAQRGVLEQAQFIRDGRFWEYAAPESVRQFFVRHPELFLDGKFWDDPYADVNLWSASASDQAREIVRARYDAYLSDAAWLAAQSPLDIERASRDVVVRASCSVRLLKPDSRD